MGLVKPKYFIPVHGEQKHLRKHAALAEGMGIPTENIFIAFGNSNNKKTAETSVPTVIGSVFAYSAIAISGVTGLGLGMCLMSAIKRKKEN